MTRKPINIMLQRDKALRNPKWTQIGRRDKKQTGRAMDLVRKANPKSAPQRAKRIILWCSLIAFSKMNIPSVNKKVKSVSVSTNAEVNQSGKYTANMINVPGRKFLLKIWSAIRNIIEKVIKFKKI